MRSRALFLSTVLVLGACTTSSPRTLPSSPPITKPAKPPPSRSPTPSPSASAPSGFLEFFVHDNDGRGRAGITVTYRLATGGATSSLITGAGGIARAKVAPGTYNVAVPAGCFARLEVRHGGKGRVGIVAGATPTRAPLLIDAIRRFSAGPPVQWSPEPPWPHGRTVTFFFLVFDRCSQAEAPNTDFADLAYRPSPNLILVGQPIMRSDEHARGVVHFRCVGSKDAQLFLLDPLHTADAVDLLKIRPPFDPNATWCP